MCNKEALEEKTINQNRTALIALKKPVKSKKIFIWFKKCQKQ